MKNNLEEDDKELIKEYKKGNKDSLEVIYTKYKNKLFKLIWCYVNNIEDAEDILQTVFEKLIRKIYSYKPEERASFKTYLYRIAINSCKDFLRRRKILKFIRFDLLKNIGENDNNLKRIEQNEMLEFVRKSVLELPEKYRDVIILIFYHNLRYEEVSNILNKPIGTIKSRVNYALSLLKKRMEVIKNG